MFHLNLGETRYEDNSCSYNALTKEGPYVIINEKISSINGIVVCCVLNFLQRIIE